MPATVENVRLACNTENAKARKNLMLAASSRNGFFKFICCSSAWNEQTNRSSFSRCPWTVHDVTPKNHRISIKGNEARYATCARVMKWAAGMIAMNWHVLN